MRLKLGFKFSHSSFQSLFLKISQNQMKTNEQEREMLRCQFHSTENLWVKIIKRHCLNPFWPQHDLFQLPFPGLLAQLHFGYILCFIPPGFRLKNAEMLKLPQYSTCSKSLVYRYIYIYIYYIYIIIYNYSSGIGTSMLSLVSLENKWWFSQTTQLFIAELKGSSLLVTGVKFGPRFSE